MKINPIGEWTGGTDVDTGATNRKLGSDMGDAVTGGGLHGKDLSKADVSVNIYLHQLAQRRDRKIALTWCAIGDDVIIPEGDQLHHEETRFSDVIEIAREYVKSIGGFEKLAEWGLIRP
jgi:S-adenosylmethionine synthetase